MKKENDVTTKIETHGAESFIRVANSIRDCVDGFFIDYPFMSIDKEGDVLLTWDCPDFFLEVTVRGCDAEKDCGCFSWFVVDGLSVSARAGLECADNISERFASILDELLIA